MSIIISKDPTEFLVRQKIVIRPTGPRYTMGELHSHKRPVDPLPELVESDSPSRGTTT